MFWDCSLQIMDQIFKKHNAGYKYKNNELFGKLFHHGKVYNKKLQKFRSSINNCDQKIL